MIAFKEEFIQRYVEKLNHKVIQELNSKLPEKGFFAEMIEAANLVVKEIVTFGEKT
jgi:hypothetical protein